MFPYNNTVQRMQDGASLSLHMLQHVAAMNVAAPLLALVLRRYWSPGLGIAALLQLTGLWFWHMPAVFTAAHHSVFLTIAMHISLFGAGLMFWLAVFTTPNPWRAIFALLVTAKLFCLLGATFIFGRQSFYPFIELGDQQLAGMIMVSSCALIYVSAAIALFVRWLGGARLAAPVSG